MGANAGLAMSATVITPSLLAGGCPPALPHVACTTAAEAVSVIIAGQTAWLLEDDDALILEVLAQLGVEGPWARNVLHYARTGEAQAAS